MYRCVRLLSEKAINCSFGFCPFAAVRCRNHLFEVRNCDRIDDLRAARGEYLSRLGYGSLYLPVVRSGRIGIPGHWRAYNAEAHSGESIGAEEARISFRFLAVTKGGHGIVRVVAGDD